MRLRSFAVCCAILLTTTRAHGQGGPPVITDDPWTPRPNHWEINSAWTVEKGPGFSSHELPIADVNYGWGHHVQLKLEVPLVVHSEEFVAHGAVGNLLAGVKWRFVDSLAGFAASVYPQVQIPRSHAAARDIAASTDWALLLPIEIAHSIGNFDVNVEVGRWLSAADASWNIAGIALGYTPRDGLDFVLECNEEGERLTSPGAAVCGLGMRRDVTEHVALMGALEPGMGGHDPDRPRLRSYLGVQAHVRGGGLFMHRPRHHG